MSYKRLIYHIVLSTHRRQRTILPEREGEMYSYIAGIVKNKGGYVHAINGMEDHVHMLIELPASISLSDFIGTLKKTTSTWLRTKKLFFWWDGWSRGYAAFTCSPLSYDSVLNYIRRQKEHHKKRTFSDELRDIVERAGLNYLEEPLASKPNAREDENGPTLRVRNGPTNVGSL